MPPIMGPFNATGYVQSTGTNGDLIMGPITQINGVIISGTPQDGYVLEATSATAASWQDPSSDITLSGDVTGTASANTVIQIQGNAVENVDYGAIQDGYVLTWTNADDKWEAKPVSSETNLVGDVTGPEGANTLITITGASPIAITPANLQWTKGTVSPLLSQATLTTNVATTNLTISPQAPAASATGTNKNAGSVIISIPASIAGATKSGTFLVQESGNGIVSFGPYGRLTGLATASMWLSSDAGAELTSNYTLQNDGFSQCTLNTHAMINLSVNTFQVVMVGSQGMTLGFNSSFDYGGGTNIFCVRDGTAPTTNPAVSSAFLYSNNAALYSRDFVGTITSVTPFGSGTVNTQIQKQLAFTQYARIVTSGATTTLSIPLATSTTNCKLQATVVAKIAIAGSLNAAGDTFADTKLGTFKNVAGTVSQVGTSVDLTASQSDSSLNTCAITFTISGTNIQVVFTANATAGTLGSLDCTLRVDQIIN